VAISGVGREFLGAWQAPFEPLLCQMISHPCGAL
jgi:hypothetical protein